MAEPTHRQLIEAALTLVADGMAPWVSERMVASMGPDWLLKVSDGRPGRKVSITDPQFLLKLVDDRWYDIFGKHLSNTERSYIKLLRDIRNEWAHDPARQFSADEVYRTLDQASVLLESIAAPEAEQLNKAKRDLQRRKDERQVREQARIFTADDEATAVTGVPPWREIIVPHADVREGRLRKAEFAADLWQVYRGNAASAEYLDPVEFFRRTYPTEGLRSLLTWSLQRTGDAGGQPVIDLQTNFGGGKTHSLLALYHLFGGVDPGEVQWLTDLVSAAGVPAVPRARQAVLVGNKIQAGEPETKPDGTVIRTLWGELAYQLGGPEGYALVRGADETATNPGGALVELLRMCSPCLILIDEWVSYARQLYDREGLPGGSFETQFTFAQTLTESVVATSGACLVVSLPQSTRGDVERETGGPAGRESLERIRHVVGRISTPWRPASKEEAYEIVRRRLFEPMVDADAVKRRDALVRAFADYYKKHRADFPQGVSEAPYSERLRAAYPIHPDLFDRLYEDWSILPRFQRTRGVLRLMASVIESLWRTNDQAPLIMSGGLPLSDPSVRDELQQMLEDRWDAVITEEVDGEESRPAKVEQRKTRLGQRRVCRRLTRAIFISSVPWWRADPGRAARDDRALRLSVALPGEQPALFTDALADLTKELRNLYTDRGGYYFSLQTNLTARAEDLARDMSDQAVEGAIAMRLGEELRGDRGPLTGGVHPWPPSPADVPDEREVRLVVLPLSAPHGKADPSEAAEKARSIAVNGRGGARKY
ncbi:MAG: Swt1 family HEPN domain-containing protein, partial [Actinomycetota bacterium]|nr:Swt1 family HEPN domain-containing protein [Actinomycetota bacterium]